MAWIYMTVILLLLWGLQRWRALYLRANTRIKRIEAQHGKVLGTIEETLARTASIADQLRRISDTAATSGPEIIPPEVWEASSQGLEAVVMSLDSTVGLLRDILALDEDRQ